MSSGRFLKEGAGRAAEGRVVAVGGAIQAAQAAGCEHSRPLPL